MSKRAALCFSGQLRNVELGFKHIDANLIQPNCWDFEFDIFVHSWFEKSYIGNSFIASNGAAASTTIGSDTIKTLYELYNPRRMLLEHQIFFDEKDYNTRKSALIKPKNTLSKNFSIKRVGGLIDEYERENNIRYDVVVQLRFDLGIQSPINLNDFDLTKVNVSTHGVWMGEGVDVSHAIMNSNLFHQYHQFYDSIDLCFRQYNVEFCDERLMHKYFDISNIPYVRNSLLNNYTLIRG
jgi:hypothetical protein